MSKQRQFDEPMDFDRDAVLSAFVAEAAEGLDLMEQSLLAAERDAAALGFLNDIFRVAHTIKGNAAALELTELARFAHEMEDLLDGIRNHQFEIDKDMITLLLKAVDALRAIVPAAASGTAELTPAQLEIKDQITKLVKGGLPNQVSGASQDGPSPKAPNGAAAPSSGARRTLRVDIDKLDHMLDLTGEIAIAQGRLRRMIEGLPAQQSGIREVQLEAERLYMDLQEQVMRIRMVPLEPLFRQFVRSVRDIASGHNKQARLEVIGGDVEVDTTVIENLKDPLVHMIRNAIDHGIESPERRRAGGKNECGVITLAASHSAGNIVISIHDDGAGFDRQKIAAKARKLGLIAESDRLTDQELFQVVFEAGFSTAESVTDISGRGVGMDVVRRNIEALRGAIHVSSEEGAGTTITIRLPLTLAIIDGFSVKSGEETYVVPLEYVTECVEMTPEGRTAGSSGIVNLRGSVLPYVRLRELFETAGEAPSRENILVVKAGEQSAGIAVDELLGDMQAVIKPLGKVFQGIPGIAGSTILGDGRVGLILDVPGLLREVTQKNLQPQLG